MNTRRTANIPADAANWDSGDWIEWHRSSFADMPEPCAAASEDEMAKLLAVFDVLLHAACSYHRLTGLHLSIYPAIAALYGSIHHDLPHRAGQTGEGWTRVECIPPQSETQAVTVDLTVTFDQLLVVRITPEFKVEGRMIAKSSLPQTAETQHSVRWSDLPVCDSL